MYFRLTAALAFVPSILTSFFLSVFVFVWTLWHTQIVWSMSESHFTLSLSPSFSLSRSITSFILSRRRRRQRSGISENIFSIKMLPSKLAISSSMFYLLLFTFSPFLLQNDRLDLTKNKHKERNRWLSKSGQMLPYLLTYLPKCRYKTFRKLGRVFLFFLKLNQTDTNA